LGVLNLNQTLRTADFGLLGFGGLLTGVAFFNGVAGLDLTLDPFASSLGAGLIGVTFFLAF